jgi:hypothetical protein
VTAPLVPEASTRKPKEPEEISDRTVKGVHHGQPGKSRKELATTPLVPEAAKSKPKEPEEIVDRKVQLRSPKDASPEGPPTETSAESPMKADAGGGFDRRVVLVSSAEDTSDNDRSVPTGGPQLLIRMESGIPYVSYRGP